MYAYGHDTVLSALLCYVLEGVSYTSLGSSELLFWCFHPVFPVVSSPRSGLCPVVPMAEVSSAGTLG